MADNGHAGARETTLKVAPEPRHSCHICGHHGGGLVLLFGRWMCRDRVDCYQRFKAGL